MSSFKRSLCRDPLNSLKGILVRRSCEFFSRISVWRSKDIAYPKLLWPHCLGSLSKIIFKVTQVHCPNACAYLDIMFLRKCHNHSASLLLSTAVRFIFKISELRVVTAFCKQVVPATKSARHEMSPTDKMKRSVVTGMAKYHSVAHGRRHLKTQLESRRIRPVHTLHTCIMVRLQRMHLLRSFHECESGTCSWR